MSHATKRMLERRAAAPARRRAIVRSRVAGTWVFLEGSGARCTMLEPVSIYAVTFDWLLPTPAPRFGRHGGGRRAWLRRQRRSARASRS